MDQSNLEERVLRFWSVIQGSHDTNLEVGTVAGSLEKYCLLACFPWPPQLAFLNISKPHAWNSTAHSDLDSYI